MMKTMKPGSQLYRLMCLLSVAGEYPVKSLHLLGNKRMYRKLVKEGFYDGLIFIIPTID